MTPLHAAAVPPLLHAGFDISDLYLSRYADAMLWMARYMERAKNLARLLDVVHTFSPASRGEQNWQAVIAIHQDEAAYQARYRTVTGRDIIRFYMTDATNPSAMVSCVSAARFNASQLRPAISTEMWVQINTMHNFLREIDEPALMSPELPTLLLEVRRKCQTFSGITDGSLYRNQGWYFYLLGRYLERADQLTRLLDIKYHLLLPSAEAVGSSIDASQWSVLLRAAGAYHTFHRENRGFSAAMVAEFLLMDAQFPRSVAFCVNTIHDALRELQEGFGLSRLGDALDRTEALCMCLVEEPIDTVIARGLHEYLDRLQTDLAALADSIGAACF